MSLATEQTLTSSADEPELERSDLLLVCMGSPERRFQHAGTVVPIDDGHEEIDPSIWTQVRWTIEGGDSTPNRVEAVRRELVRQMAEHHGELRAVAAALRCEVEDVQRWTIRLSIRPEFYQNIV